MHILHILRSNIFSDFSPSDALSLGELNWGRGIRRGPETRAAYLSLLSPRPKRYLEAPGKGRVSSLFQRSIDTKHVEQYTYALEGSLMGLISNLLRGWERKRLENILENNPRPPAEVFLRLAVIYMEEGDQMAASRIAKRGQNLYPRNLEVSRAYKNTEKIVREMEKERLRQKIESYPNPILYARLAELYKADSQIDAAVQVCQAGIRAFPEYGGTYLLLGQLSFERGDYDGALSYLEKATDLDRYNYMALKLLADSYMKKNRPKEAVERLEQILYFAPGDEVVMEALKIARRAAGIEEAPRPAAAKAVATTVIEPSRKPTRVRPAQPVKAAPSGRVREQGLTDAMNIFKELTGVRGALLVDAYGLVIASHLTGDVEEDLAGAMVTNIYRATAKSAEQMGLGAFEDGLIEGEAGNIHIVAIRDMILAVFAEASLKMGLLEKAVRDFASAVLEVG